MKDEVDPPPDKLRSAREVAERCVVLMGVIAAGYQQPRSGINTWLQTEKVWHAVSPQEASFLEAENPARQQLVNATWRAEALHALLWALGRMELCQPSECCDLDILRQSMPDLYADASGFISSAKLRSEEMIRRVLGAIYHIHWAVRDAQINSRSIPSGYNAGAVRERHYAYNWLTGYCGQEWDDVLTDT